MIVMLEGADGSGKTTLAKKMATRFGAVHVACTVSANVLDHHRWSLRAAVEVSNGGGIAVLDRHWVSEFVYGPIFRGSAGYPDANAVEMDLEMIARGAIHVLAVPTDMRAHLARFEASKAAGREMFDRVEEVAIRYRDLFQGNVAHPGENLVDRYVRFGDFASSRKFVRYDIDVDGPHLDAFVERLLKIGRHA